MGTNQGKYYTVYTEETLENETGQFTYNAYIANIVFNAFVSNEISFIRCITNDGDIFYFNRDKIVALQEKTNDGREQ